MTDEGFVGAIDDDGHTIGASLLVPNGREHKNDESTNRAADNENNGVLCKVTYTKLASGTGRDPFRETAWQTARFDHS